MLLSSRQKGFTTVWTCQLVPDTGIYKAITNNPNQACIFFVPIKTSEQKIILKQKYSSIHLVWAIYGGHLDFYSTSILARPLNLAAMSDLRSGVLSQIQEVLHLPGVFLNCFLKETSQEDGRNKNWTMQRLLHRTLRFRCSPTGEQIQNGRMAANKFKMADWRMNFQETQ